MKQAKQTLGISLLLVGALFLLPLAVLRPEGKTPDRIAALPEETMRPPISRGEQDRNVILQVLHGDTVEEMDLGTYLACVVRAEMPASFEEDALCAQAVAARTYTMYKLRGGSNHTNADICTDSTCCQAYMTKTEAQANWGTEAEENEAKIQRAVTDTDGQVILYHGAPILAVFHSCSAGQTRGAGEVWQNDLPYLQPVSSPEPTDSIPNYYSRVEFTAKEFQEAVRQSCPQATFKGAMQSWLNNAVVDSAGNVETVDVGGVTVKGATLRGILGLRSACFEWQVEGEQLVFYVTGYGHGVGLSQYGANRMAQEGYSWREILTHYYTGVSVEPYDPETGRNALQ